MGQVIPIESFIKKLIERKLKDGRNEILVAKDYFSFDVAVEVAMRHTAGLIVQDDGYLFTKYKCALQCNRHGRNRCENRATSGGAIVGQ